MSQSSFLLLFVFFILNVFYLNASAADQSVKLLELNATTKSNANEKEIITLNQIIQSIAEFFYYFTQEPCTDYPSCQLISPQMFTSYCNRSTLKNMCPTYCDPECKAKSKQSMVKDDDDDSSSSSPSASTTSSTTTTTTSTTKTTPTASTSPANSKKAAPTKSNTNNTNNKKSMTAKSAATKPAKAVKKAGSKVRTKQTTKANQKANKGKQATTVNPKLGKKVAADQAKTTPSSSIKNNGTNLANGRFFFVVSIVLVVVFLMGISLN